MTAITRRRFDESTGTTAPKTGQEIAEEGLRAEIARFDRRLSAIELELVGCNGAKASELMDEQSEVATLRRIADAKLRAMLDPIVQARKAKAAENRAKQVDALTRHYTTIYNQSAETTEAEGDHRSARLFRMEALNARALAEKEAG
jgi:hypothetical protein